MIRPRTPLAWFALLTGLVLAVLTVVAPWFWGDLAARTDLTSLHEGPSDAHLLGTDDLGRDLLARLLVATRYSIGLAVVATLLGVTAGLALGTVSAVVGRRARRLLVAVVDLLVAFPGLFVALVLAVVFGLGARGAVLGIAFAIAPGFARLTQNLIASVSARDFVAASRILGVSRVRILVRHILPNVAEPLVISATLNVGYSLLGLASLSFLGLGVQTPDYDWGQMLNQGLDRIYVTPVAAIAPGVAIMLCGLAFNLMGEAVAAGFARHGTPRARRLGAVPAPTPVEPDPTALLRVENLSVEFGPARPVAGVSLRVGPGEIVSIVGESGSGKSLTALAAAGLIEEPGRVDADVIEFTGQDLRGMGRRPRRALLGSALSFVFQDPMTSLNPALRVGRQLAEVAEEHRGLSRQEANAEAVRGLERVRIDDAAHRARQYPHEFSGGMRQRAVIGMGLMITPRLVIADEPTTALDVLVQQEVLALLAGIREHERAGMVFISHDIAVVASLSDRVVVMYAGEVVEQLPTERLLTEAAHPYTRALLAVVPRMDLDRDVPLPSIDGRPPDPADQSTGCPFAPRCASADDHCTRQRPPLVDRAEDHSLACWHPVASVSVS